MGESTSLHLLDGRTSAHALTYGMLRASRTLELDDQLLRDARARFGFRRVRHQPSRAHPGR